MRTEEGQTGKDFHTLNDVCVCMLEDRGERVVCPGQGSAQRVQASGTTLRHTEKTTGVQSIRGGPGVLVWAWFTG